MIQIVSFLSLLITAALVAFFARRILGAPIGWPTSIIVGALMLSLLGSALLRPSRNHGPGGRLRRRRQLDPQVDLVVST